MPGSNNLLQTRVIISILEVILTKQYYSFIQVLKINLSSQNP